MFEETLDRLTRENGWTEWCPTRRFWTFTKKKWTARVDWYTKTIDFTYQRSCN